MQNIKNNKVFDIEEIINSIEKENVHKNKKIKENGIIYTPKYIADYIVSILKPKLNERIFEPSVGHGIFIFAILDYIQKEFKLNPIELKKYLINNVYGFDIDKNNIKELKMLINLYFQKKIDSNIEIKEIELKNNFKTINTIFFDFKTIKKFDIIIGNPPYVNNKIMKKELLDFLKINYNSCKKGNIDLYYAFMELSINNSNRCSFIIPNSWLYNKSSENLRIKFKNNLIKVIDFKDKMIFKNASIYSSIFLYSKENNQNYIEYSEDINEKSPIKLIYKDDLNNERWNFNLNQKDIYKYINNYAKIKDTLKFYSPIATLRDKIYIFTKEKDIDKNLNFYDNNDLINFIKISKIKTKKEFYQKINTEEMKIIFPYNFSENNKILIKEENELNKETLIYLNSVKNELLKRDKGKTEKYEKWYSYGRKQGIKKINKNSFLIIIPGMIAKDYNFFMINSNQLKLPFLFSSGFILEINSSETDTMKILNYFNSKEFNEFIINNGKIWKGKNKENSYYSLSITQLRKLFNIEK